MRQHEKSTEGLHTYGTHNLTKPIKHLYLGERQKDQILLPITGGHGSVELPIVFHMSLALTDSWADYQVCRLAFQPLSVSKETD